MPNKNIEIKLGKEKIKFTLVNVTIERNISQDIFGKYDNKTFGYALNKNYKHLKPIFNQDFSGSLKMPLGLFLMGLKKRNDRRYFCFLNKNGDNNFCKFSIESNKNDKGIYCFVIRGKIKYIGRCIDNFGKRINAGYGSIQPRNCYIGGQSTNCHINSLVYKSKLKKIQIGLYKMKSVRKIKTLEKQILSCNQFDWNIQNN